MKLLKKRKCPLLRKWLPYLLVFWCAALLHEAYRLSPGTELAKWIGLFTFPPSVWEISLLPYDPRDLLTGLIAAAALLGVLAAKC